ncbi:aspartic protease [Aphelenchoides avenae]|nr:aspartic protease [Aphelenchus avenae]
MMLLLLVPFIVGLSQAAVFRVPAGFDEDNGLVNAQGPQTPLETAFDVQLWGYIQIGTPGQKLRTRYDTGSDLVWVKDVCCHDGDGHPCDTGSGWSFDCSASTTCQESGETFQGGYGGGSYANGTYVHETISLVDGDETKVTVENTQVGRATVLQGFSTIDASLGLAPTSPFIKDVQERKIFDENIFTVWIHEVGRAQGQAGLITYGAFDSEHCDRDIAYIPLDEECGLHYCIKFDKVVYGDQAEYPGGFAVSDTGNSVIRGPLHIVEEIARRAGSGGEKTKGGDYSINCDAHPEPLVFHIGDRQFALEAKHLIAVDPYDQTRCRFIMRGERGRTVWMFGVPFIRQFCQVYDFGNRRLGLAKSLS